MEISSEYKFSANTKFHHLCEDLTPDTNRGQNARLSQVPLTILLHSAHEMI